MLTTLYNTGARVSELIYLCIDDVSLESSPEVRILGKGSKGRQVPLWASIAREGKRWLQSEKPPGREQPLSLSDLSVSWPCAVGVGEECLGDSLKKVLYSLAKTASSLHAVRCQPILPSTGVR